MCAFWDESTLESFKIIVMDEIYIFFAFKIFDNMCTPNLIQYCELWVDLRSLKLDLIRFSKKINRR
jgi:hypothetical protein